MTRAKLAMITIPTAALTAISWIRDGAGPALGVAILGTLILIAAEVAERCAR